MKKLDSGRLGAVLDQMKMIFPYKEQYHQQTFELNCEEDSDGCCLCKVKNSRGSSTDPWGTPDNTGSQSENTPFITTL